MRIIAVDDEQLSLTGLLSSIKQACPEANISGFRRPTDALANAAEAPCDAAFLDIDMREMDGIELARQLKLVSPKVNIIFVTGYSQYAGDAFSLHASGYVMKPATGESVLRELENLRYPVPRASGKRVVIQTFGNFEALVDGKKVLFRLGKTKELLAYLVDRRGAFCSTGEIIGVLWENDTDMLKRKSYFRDLRSDLLRTFRDLGCDEVIDKRRDNIAIVPDRLDCDYYDWLKGEPYAINAYFGEYMSQYSWAEGTLAAIEKKLD